MSDSTRPSFLAILSALTPIVIAALGGYFTHIYKMQETESNRIASDRLLLERQQRFLIDKATVVKQYFDYLANKADVNQQKAALAVLASLGYTDLVIKLVTTDPTSENVRALIAIATTGDKEETNSAVGALESLASTSDRSEVSKAAEQALTTTQAASSAAGSRESAVIAGADKTLEAAQTEVSRLNEAGFADAKIIKKDGWYRTVVPVTKPEQQQAILNDVQTKIRRSAYAVDFNKWCERATADIKCSAVLR